MKTKLSTRLRTGLGMWLGLVLAGAFASAAFGISVYSNDFSTKAEYEQIVRSGGGKSCERRYRAKQNTMLVSVKKGGITCSFRVPVQGDSELPNHAVGVESRILASTPKAMRKGAFVEVTLRAGGGGTGYTLRIFPARKKFELIRGPAGGGEFPVRGRNTAIKGIDERNNISLTARGARITASVNRKELVTVEDNDPGQVTGRKVRIAVGSRKKASKPVAALINSVGVGVPTN